MCIGGMVAFIRFMPVVTIILVLIVGSVLYHRYLTAPACDFGDAIFAATSEVSSGFPTGGLNVRNIRTITGGLFSSHRECEMEVTPIANSTTQIAPKWTRVTYSTFRLKSPSNGNVAARIAGPLTINSTSRPHK